jgi:uncharacterized protein involved in outer membrane biogenesis
VACYARYVKRLFLWALRVAAVGALLGFALLLLKDTLLKRYLEHRLSTETGMKAEIEQFHWKLRTDTITIRNLKLYNSAEFGGAPFLDLPELTLAFVRAEVAAGRLHLRNLRLQLAVVRLVKNKDGKLNVTFEDEDPKSVPSEKPSKSRLEFTGIDRLNLTLGKVTYTDLQNSTNNTEYDLQVKDELLTDVRSESDVVDWLLKRLLTKAPNGFASSIHFDSARKPKRTRRGSVSPGTNSLAVAPATNRVAQPAAAVRTNAP